MDSPVFHGHKDMSIKGYTASVKQYDATLRNNLAEELRCTRGWAISILLTGSCARLEKGPYNPMEIIALSDTFPYAHGDIKALETFVTKYDPETLSHKVEVSHIGQNYFFEYERTHLAQKLLDSTPIAGDKKLYEKALVRAIRERQGQRGTTLQNRLALQARKSRSVILSNGIESDKNKLTTHYDLEKGIVNYDPPNDAFGISAGSINYLQQLYVRDMYDLIATKTWKEALITLKEDPKNMSERVYWLEANGRLADNGQDAPTIVKAYQELLRESHQIEQSFVQTRKITCKFNSQKVRENSEKIARIEKLINAP